MVRSPWIVSVVGGLIVVPSALLLLGRHVSGDLAAVLGLLVIWIYGFVGGVLYEALVRREVPFQGDERTWPAEARARGTRWYGPCLAVFLFLPGLWVGALARSPLPIAAGYLLAGEAVRWVLNAVPSGLPPGPPGRRWDPEVALERAGTLAAGVVAGVCLRLLLGA